MNSQTVITFAAVAELAALTPGPATLLTIRNGVTFGVRSVIWPALGNISGIFLLSVAATLGLGVLLMSSAVLFGVVKVCGALYLFYIGGKHFLGDSLVLVDDSKPDENYLLPSRRKLYREALLTAATNPKAVLFFTALFPQFVNSQAPLLPQFLLLTGVFMALSYVTQLSYALIAARSSQWLRRPSFSTWVKRVVGTAFIAFGSLVLTIRREA